MDAKDNEQENPDIAIFAVEVPIKENKKPEVLKAKDGEIESPEKYEVFGEGDDEAKEENLKDTSKKIDARNETSSCEEKAEENSVELVKKQVEEHVKRENYTTEFVNKSSLLPHEKKYHKYHKDRQKKYHKKELPNVKVSNNYVPKTKKSKVEKEVVKVATSHEIVGESAETIKRPINRDDCKEDFENERSLWLHGEEISNNSVSSSEDSRNDSLDETCQFRGDSDERNEDLQKHMCRGKLQSDKPTGGNNDKSVRNAVTKQQAETRSKEEKTTDGLLSLRFKA